MDDDANTVARLTEAGSTTYTAAFRNHSGKREPLPGQGVIAHLAELVTALLGMFLHPDSYLSDSPYNVLGRRNIGQTSMNNACGNPRQRRLNGHGDPPFFSLDGIIWATPAIYTIK